MMKHFATTCSLFTLLSMCWGQGLSTEMLLTEAPCVNVHSDMVQHDVVVRLVVPPLTNLDVPPQNVQLGRSDGQLLPFWQGQVWADSTELWVRFDSLDTEEELLFFFSPEFEHPNDPSLVFDLYDSFDGAVLDESIWSTSILSGASYQLDDGALVMNVTNTDNYCSIYTNETFDLGKKWGTLVQTRTEDNRGHYVVGMGSGYDSQRVNNGGYNQLRGYILFESHDDDWAIIVNVEGSQHGSDRFGDDSTYSTLNASWEDQRYQGRAGGELMSEVPIEENDVPQGEYPFFFWLNAWDGNDRTAWVDFVAVYACADVTVDVQDTSCPLVGIVSGCTDETACNYNPDANFDDGSCSELDACGECGGVAGCNDASACNFNPAATCDDGSCDYCSCVGEVVFGANFDDVLIQYGANELFTTDEDLDLSSIEGQRILDVEGGEGYFIVMNEDSTLTTLCEGCLYGNPPPSTWKVLDVEVGRHEGCLVRVDGSLHSFGANYLGLQNEPTVDNAIQCAASWNFHMALLDDGEIVGWGNGWEPCPLPLSDVVEIDAGGGHAVALMENGTLVEWGRLDDGSVAHSQEWILDLEQVVHVVAGQNSTWMFFADGSAKLVEFPSGEVWLELPAGSGVVDGDRNWAVTAYLKNDGGVYIQQNSGTSEVELDLSAHENCGTCVLDSDEDGTCNLDEVFGCADEAGCNYTEEATQNAGCVYPILPEADCSAGSVMCGEGTVWDTASQTCLSAPSEQGPCLDGTVWDEDLQGCIVANPSDTDFDGCVSMTDLLDLLTVFGTCAEEEPEEEPEVAEWSCGDPLEYQGYDYETVQIGEQCWFAENLRSENYRNGDVIPAGLGDDEWSTTSSGAVAIYGEGVSGCISESPDGDACDEEWSMSEYGRLYNWYAVSDERGLCPGGWHVPTDEEWETMTTPLGGHEHAGKEMKTTYGWLSSAAQGTNSSGFSGLPVGCRRDPGNFLDGGREGWWWTSAPMGDVAFDRSLWFNSDHVWRHSSWSHRTGMAVRCLKDSE